MGKKNGWCNACMEVAGFASSIIKACEGRGAASVVFIEVSTSSELSVVLVPRVCPGPLNGTYLGSGGACHQDKVFIK